MPVQSPKKSSALPWPALVPLGHHAGKPPISLQKTVMLVGSRHNAHLHLLSRHVSKAHALILSHGGSVYIRDLASREQVYVNGVPQREAWLRNRDLIKIGSFTFKYKDGPTAGGTPDDAPYAADLEIDGADAPLAVADKVMLIGRRPTCDVALMEASVSTAHAVIFHVGGKRYIRDLGSRTGTFVNGAKVHQQELHPGDAIRIGETDIRYVSAAEHDHAIAPAGYAGGAGAAGAAAGAGAATAAAAANDFDELEDLVGTAPLDVEAEIQRDGATVDPGLEYDLTGAGAAAEPAAAKDDDLIELDLTPEPDPVPAPVAARPATPVPPTPKAPPPVPAAPPPAMNEPIELEVTTTPDVAGGDDLDFDVVGIDLTTEPEVADASTPTAAGDAGFERGVEPEPPTAGGQADDTLPLDLDSEEITPPAPVAAEDDEAISPRGGWQGMSRAGEADAAALPVDEELAELDLGAGDEVAAGAGVGEPVRPQGAGAGGDDALAFHDVPAVEVAPVAPAEPQLGDDDFALVEEVLTPADDEDVFPVELEVTADAAAVVTPGTADADAAVSLPVIEEIATEAPVVADAAPTVEPIGDVAPAVVDDDDDDAVIADVVVQEASVEPAAVRADEVVALDVTAHPSVVAPPADEAVSVARLDVVESDEDATPQAGVADESAADGTPAAEVPAAAVADALPDVDDAPVADDLAAPAVQPIADAPLTVAGDPATDVTAERAADGEVVGVGRGAELSVDLPVGPGSDEPETATTVTAADDGEVHADVAGDVGPVGGEVSSTFDALLVAKAEADEALPLDELPALVTEGLPAIDVIGEVEETLPAKPLVAEGGRPDALPVVDGAADDELEDVAVVEDEEAVLELPAVEADDDLEPPAAPAPVQPELDMPLLDLDARLAPAGPRRDPDALLALDQVDPDGLDEVEEVVEVIEPTEPTPDSALTLDIGGDESAVAGAAGGADASLTDSTFGRQVEAFTASTSGEIVEDDLLPEIEAYQDPEEELAFALGDAGEHAKPRAVESGGDDIELEAIEPLDEDAVFEIGDAGDVTAGGIAPAAMGVTASDSLASQQFDAGGEAVELEPAADADADADAVLNGQSFVAEADGQDAVDTSPSVTGSVTAAGAEGLGEQSFVAEGDGHAAAQHVEPVGLAAEDRPVAPAPAPPAQQGAGGTADDGGGFSIGTDLSSFIGGMPLVLPDLAPTPKGFGQTQVSFAGAKPTWQQAQRPAFPMGQGLASELMSAAEGLRDVEAMEEEEAEAYAAAAAAAAPDEDESITDDGAPGDEWNVAAVLDEDDDSAISGAWGAEPGEVVTAADLSGTAAHAEASSEAESAEALTEGTPAGTEFADADLDLEEEASEPPQPQAAAVGEEDDSALGFVEMSFDDDDDTGAGATGGAGAPAAVDESELLKELEEGGAPAADALEVTADAGVIEQLSSEEAAVEELAGDEIELELEAEVAGEGGLGVAEAADGGEHEPSGFLEEVSPPDESTVEELNFDEVVIDEPGASPPPLADGAPRAGAIGSAVAELNLDDAPDAADSVVDRTPPPPVAPAAPKAAVAAAGVAAATAAAAAAVGSAAKGKGKGMAAVTPPPPARSLRPRKGGAAVGPTEAGDAAFGGAEHGRGASGVSPFAGMNGGVREVDVFSQPSGDLGDLGRAMGPADSSVFGQEVADGGDVAPPAAGRRGGKVGKGLPARPPGAAANGGDGDHDEHAAGAAATRGRGAGQRAIVPPRMGVLGAAGAAAGSADDDGGAGGEPLNRPAYRVIAKKKSAARRVLVLVVLMLIFMAASVGAIFFFMKQVRTTTGELQFQNVGALTKMQRDALRAEQREKLNSRVVRTTALSQLTVKEVPAGFLARPEQFGRVEPSWSEDRPDVMTLSYTGTDARDKERMLALLTAMYQENAAQGDRKIRLASEVRKLEEEIAEVERMRARRAELRKALDELPDDQAVRQLEARVREADLAYEAAAAAAKEAQLEVRRAEEQLPPSPGEALLNGGEKKGGGGPADAELAELQKALEAAASKGAALKSAASEEADAKRKALDQAIEAFQATAAGMVRENPQLGEYVQAVQQLQEQTHKLSGRLIEVQQQHHNRLSDIKKSLDEQVQAQRARIWAADKELANLRAQYDLAQRKYNAAHDQGLAEDSREVVDARREIQDLTARMDGRKMAIGSDPIVTKIGDQIQELIRLTKERMEADQAGTEKDIKDQERAFAQRGNVEKLPQTQQAQAKVIKEKQEAINELRRQYAAALDKRTAESNAALQEAERQVSQLTAKVEERKRILVAEGSKNLTQQQEAQRRAALEQRQAALRQAEDQKAAALKVSIDRDKALRQALAARGDGGKARQELESIETTLAQKAGADDQNKLTLEDRRDQLKKLVTAAKPGPENVREFQKQDERWLYALGAVVGCAVLFGVLMALSVAGESRGGGGGGGEGEEFPTAAEAGPLAIRQIGGGNGQGRPEPAVF